jgi:very-short-patch-repair endonuclease
MKNILFEKSFATCDKQKYWNNKNIVKPHDVSLNSHKMYFFDCNECNHIFKSVLRDVNRGSWCPYCANKKLCDDIKCDICHEKSFLSNKKSKYWNCKNSVTPRQVFITTHKKYWFNCDKCEHVFEKLLNNDTWCPYCANIKLCENNNCSTCFTKSFESHYKSKFFIEKKNNTIPRQIFLQSNNAYFFKCDKCLHTFKTYIYSIVNNHSWCSYCSTPPKQLCSDNNCTLCLNKSFLSHEKSKYWSDKNNVKPRDIFVSTGKKYWFNCDKCKHVFKCKISTITIINGSWCPYCVNKQLCKNTDCKLCLNKSFLLHEKSKYLSIKNNINPRNIFINSADKYWFDCVICKHSFDCKIYNITSGRWCPYCSVPCKKLCDDIKCKFCFNKSFLSHNKSKYWSSKNNIEPRNVYLGSGKKYWFKCDDCFSEFETNLQSIVGGCWCPNCKNKTEKKLYIALLNIYPNIKCQYKVEWCKNKNCLPFDFCIDEHKIIIELDGRQHFEQVSNWISPEINHKTDKFKMKCANENFYSVIRILQEDIYYDKYDWLSKIIKNIEKIKNNKCVKNKYICYNNEYKIFKN